MIERRGKFDEKKKYRKKNYLISQIFDTTYLKLEIHLFYLS